MDVAETAELAETRNGIRVHPPSLTPQRKRASLLVNQICEEIIAEGWTAGHALGSETELAQRYSVSHAIVREAARLLEHMRIAEMRRGANGGLVISQPDVSAVSNVLATYLEFVRVEIDELIETRRELEPFVVGLAMERLTESGIGYLRALRQREPSPHWAVREVTRLARNPALSVCVESVLELLERRLAPSDRTAHVDAWRESGNLLIEAILSGDPGLAKMALELDLTTSLAATQQSDGDDFHWNSLLDGSRPNLSEVVARSIIRMIDRRGLNVGDLVGSEEYLVTELEVSRGALREALRILEYYNIAAMRPGPGGGLIVAEATPERVVENASVHLDLMGVTPRQLHEMRRAVELPAIERATARLTRDVELRLRDIIELVGAMTPDDVNEIGYCLDLAIADAAVSRPLDVFVRIAARLQSERVEQYLQDPVEKIARTKDLIAVQTRIAEAVLARDVEVARHRLLRHLESIHRFVMPQPTLPRQRRMALSRVAT